MIHWLSSFGQRILFIIIEYMGAVCQQSKREPLEMINSFDQGLEKNLITHSYEAPQKSYAIRVYALPIMAEQISKILTAEIQAQKIVQQNLKGVQLPPFLIHGKEAYYQGEWKDRVPHGKGKIYFSEGHYFQGYVKAGQVQCRDGILIFCDGSFYRGGFQGSQFSGIGKFASKTGIIYEGNWQNGKPQGIGKQTFEDGNQYEGQFQNGMKHGQGIFRWKDGKVYQGQFSKGKMNGNGKFYRGTDQYFQGRFVNNKKVGNGKLKTAYGVYQGSFEEGEFGGKGRFQWNNHNVYEGTFRAGNLDGEGLITFSNKKRFKGVWKQGQNIELLQIPPSDSPKKKK